MNDAIMDSSDNGMQCGRPILWARHTITNLFQIPLCSVSTLIYRVSNDFYAKFLILTQFRYRFVLVVTR